MDQSESFGSVDSSIFAWIFALFHPFAEPNTFFSISVGLWHLINVFRQELHKSVYSNDMRFAGI